MKKGMPKIVLQGYEELGFQKKAYEEASMSSPEICLHVYQLCYDLRNMPYS